ncbi:exo-beta-N-acetylmuramidase NamZ domain-containing protein, partial [Lysinibacillus sp. GbtcB16]|uniref:exo-beta-N-acetylmuramidase NamZ domain-containing protein n=1 Tax=Lysinibacillus sp. GbtcB16 TaxID=2824761 RepID=UPI002811BFB9
MANDQMNWQCDLHVVPCEGWERSMMFSETGKEWIMPSLGLPRFISTLLYPGTCIFEGTNLSEGRGTTVP